MSVCVSVELRCYINPFTPCHITTHYTISSALLTATQKLFPLTFSDYGQNPFPQASSCYQTLPLRSGMYISLGI